MRINRFLSDCGYCSRRKADQLISEGKVKINSKIAVLGDQVSPTDDVIVEGRSISPKTKKHYIAFNKPKGVVCTTDKNEPMNIIDYINYPERIFPIGRLDKDSEGLILLTSDGLIVNKILRAEHNHHKEYEVHINRPITHQQLKKLESGVKIFNPVKNKYTKVAAVSAKFIGKNQDKLIIILNQGLNRQIRRMIETLDANVTRLIRKRIMHIKLGKLKPGTYRRLSEAEVKGIKVDSWGRSPNL